MWFGIRGTDAAPLLRVPQFAASFSIVDRLGAASLDTTICLESITGRRVDLDAYDMDLDSSDEARRFRGELLRVANTTTAVASYRPSHLVETVVLSGGPTCRRVGMFKERQSAYEFKPWVERELAGSGGRVIPWRYVADEYRSAVGDMLNDGPIVLRATRGSGGEGVTLLRSVDDLEELWPSRDDGIASVARFIDPAVPTNVAGCVYRDGTVAIHPLSIQLIGIPECTDRPFGYCGNDFAAAASFSAAQLADIEAEFGIVGRWLASTGYIGAFGLDLLVSDAGVFITEVNARLQGSSALSSELCAVAGFPDIVTEHVAAGLGLPPPSRRPLLAELVEAIEPASQVIIHAPQCVDDVTKILGAPSRTDLDPPPSVSTVDPGAVIARLFYRGSVTANGYCLGPRENGDS